MAKIEQKTFQTLDIWLSSYLSLCGIKPKLELNNGKVVFTFPVSDDLYKLMEIGVHGVIIGTALYEGKFTIKQALEVVNGAD